MVSGAFMNGEGDSEAALQGLRSRDSKQGGSADCGWVHLWQRCEANSWAWQAEGWAWQASRAMHQRAVCCAPAMLLGSNVAWHSSYRSCTACNKDVLSCSLLKRHKSGLALLIQLLHSLQTNLEMPQAQSRLQCRAGILRTHRQSPCWQFNSIIGPAPFRSTVQSQLLK